MVACTKCKTPLEEEVFNTIEPTRCPSCRASIRVDVFPALFRAPAVGTSGETLVIEDEASCFYHPQKKAVIPCSNCGRFLCALCDIEFNDRHLCPACLEVSKREHKIKDLDTHRTLYDQVVLALAVVPLLIFYLTIITAPLAIILAIRYWKAPLSIIPRTRIRFIIALIFAGLQIIGWSAALYFGQPPFILF